jgi:hypothetical protein
MVFTIPKAPMKGMSAKSLAASTEGVRPTLLLSSSFFISLEPSVE